jgi:hypothetical protein
MFLEDKPFYVDGFEQGLLSKDVLTYTLFLLIFENPKETALWTGSHATDKNAASANH